MKNNFYFNKPLENLYLEPSNSSEVVSQILYGENFKILKKKKDWIKIKLNFDNYIGYIKKNKFNKNFSPKIKVKKLKANIFVLKKNKFMMKKDNIFFGSKLSILRKKNNFYEFEKNKWIQKKDIVNINSKEKNFIKIFKLFLRTKYKWGGKTCEGIDCSGLIQMFFFYNNLYCPRDTNKQIPFFLKNKKKYPKISKSIIFWKGHVAICENNKNLIHAYGPKKKVIKMNIKKTIEKIYKDTGLKPIYIK